MTKTDDDVNRERDALLGALMDGELDAHQAREVNDRIARDQELGQRLESLQGVDRTLRDAFAATLDEPLPDALRALVDPPSRTAGGRKRERERESGRVLRFPGGAAAVRRWFPVAAAAGVAFVFGVLVGPVPEDSEGTMLFAEPARLAPGTALHEVVASMPSGRPGEMPDGRVVVPQYTFESRAGDVCRKLTVTGAEGAMNAVVCRDADGWQMRLTSFEAQAEMSGYAPATGRQDPFDAAIDAMMVGAPLQADAERKLLRAE